MFPLICFWSPSYLNPVYKQDYIDMKVFQLSSIYWISWCEFYEIIPQAKDKASINYLKSAMKDETVSLL